jgi:hypothetical protein
MGGPIPNPFASRPSAPAPQPAPAPAPVAAVAATTYAPTTSEVSQASATDAAGIKRRRRGRSPTILTGAAGVQEGATLGTPTLLG